MTETGGGGVLLGGVATDGPADLAGLAEGDVIVELAGQVVDTLYDYARIMDGLKVGEEVSVTVLRNGETLELKITPTSRE
jgi:S1-C subfamily serine protease